MLRVTKVESGMVAGATGTDARITVYKGIPFAADTSGENRWRAPQPVKPWEGVRKCFEFAPITMQPIPGKNPDAFYSKEWHVDPEVPMSEDGSLVVNVWTPAKAVNEKLPVMVWIFGGGLHEGYAHEMEFDGERIASRGVVLATISYRLNVFGFLAHPDLTAENPEAPANFGFLDQKAGIEWVKRNIANFGGDPENITIFGQSAGGVSVFAHLCSPQTEGLFQKAVIMSSAGGAVKPVYPKTPFGNALPLAEAEKFGAKFLKEQLGVDTIAEARKLDAEFIRDKVVSSGIRFPQTIENKFMTDSIFKNVFTDKMHKVPVMIGYTEDEMPSGVVGGTDAEVEAWAKENWGPYADEFLTACRAKAAESGKTLGECGLVNANENSTRLVAEKMAQQGRTVYGYAFDPEIPGDNAGSFHSSDLWFVFETLQRCWRPFDGHHMDLARKMCNYWTNFAKTGNPNGNDKDGTPMVEWTPYTEESPCVIHFYDDIEMEQIHADTKRDVMLRANREAFAKELEG